MGWDAHHGSTSKREAGASLLEIADKNQVGNGGAGRGI